MYRINPNIPLTTDAISAYIQHFTSTASHYRRLYAYYIGQHDILQRSMTAGKPNNRIVNPYGRYITTLFTGYMLGSPVTYNAPDDAQEQLQSLQDVFNYNDEQAHNSDVARDMSIYGVAVELLYTDENSNVRFARLNPQEVVPIYDDSISGSLAYVIRFFSVQEDILNDIPVQYVQVFSKTDTVTYKGLDTGLVEIDRVTHFFNDVPVNIFYNNDEAKGDWESCIPLIDAADKLASDSVNETEYAADAYLVLTGYGDLGISEDNPSGTVAQQMKDNRLIMLPDASGSAQWVVKNLNDAYIQNLRKNIDTSIHKFSMCPAMTDEQFASNASGVAMKYKLLGFENATATKERNFKKALQRRIELIDNWLTARFNVSYDYRNIEITFNRNLPTNDLEAAQLVTQLRGIISQETALSQLPFVTDVQAEMDKVNAEAQTQFNMIQPIQQVMPDANQQGRLA